MQKRTVLIASSVVLLIAMLGLIMGFKHTERTNEQILQANLRAIDAQDMAKRAKGKAEYWQERSEEASATVEETRRQLEEVTAEAQQWKAKAQVRQTTKVTTSVNTTKSYNTAGVEQWRALVEKYFGANTDAALSVMRKESGGNPNATNKSSGAAGLFQQMPQYWAQRSAAAGFAGASIYDPEANIAASAMLSGCGTNWSHWSAKP